VGGGSTVLSLARPVGTASLEPGRTCAQIMAIRRACMCLQRAREHAGGRAGAVWPRRSRPSTTTIQRRCGGYQIMVCLSAWVLLPLPTECLPWELRDVLLALTDCRPGRVGRFFFFLLLVRRPRRRRRRVAKERALTQARGEECWYLVTRRVLPSGAE
jgi:hypothetical protein